MGMRPRKILLPPNPQRSNGFTGEPATSPSQGMAHNNDCGPGNLNCLCGMSGTCRKLATHSALQSRKIQQPPAPATSSGPQGKWRCHPFAWLVGHKSKVGNVLGRTFEENVTRINHQPKLGFVPKDVHTSHISGIGTMGLNNTVQKFTLIYISDPNSVILPSIEPPSSFLSLEFPLKIPFFHFPFKFQIFKI